MFPGLGVADVVKLLGDALFGPRSVVQESHQRLFLGELQATEGVMILKILVPSNKFSSLITSQYNQAKSA